MKFKKIYLFIFIINILVSCGRPGEISMSISGTVVTPFQSDIKGPVFIAVTSTSDYESITEDPSRFILTVAALAGDSTFDLNLSATRLKPGDDVSLVVFADNNYNGGIPNPDAGDFIGFYINRENWSVKLKLKEGENSGINIDLNRQVFDFESSIRGTIRSNYEGRVLLIAYAGDIVSMNPDDIDINRIIGYTEIIKSQSDASFELNIMPYGMDIPVEGVYVIALLDINQNGKPDAGDRLFYYSDNDRGIPSRTTVNGGILEGINLERSTELHDKSDTVIQITGSFNAAGYDSFSAPVFIFVAKTDDPNEVLEDSISVVRQFRKIEPGLTSFLIDLSSSGLEPGDKVIVAALWDRDNTGGFPNPGPQDKAGFFQSTDVENIQYTVTLANGQNHLETGNGYSFNISRIINNYQTSVRFNIDPEGLPDGLHQNSSLICVVVHEDGVNDGLFGNYRINSLDYILGMKRIPFVYDGSHFYSINLYNAIYDEIEGISEMGVYVYVIHDRNSDGMPSKDTEEDIAAYWRYRWPLYIPKKCSLESDTVNILRAPNNDEDDPHAVRFLGQAY